MPRNGSGRYSLPASYLATTGETITAIQHNAPLLDLEAEANSVRPIAYGGTGAATAAAARTALGLEIGVAVAAYADRVPTGCILDFAGSAAPSGWLLCWGQTVSRSTYSALFAAIGTTYGPGDGSTTFNLPDCRGRVSAGRDNMGGTSADRLTNQTGGLNGDALGATGGSETHTLTEAQMPTHKHGVGVTVTGTALTRSREEYAVQSGGSRVAGVNGASVSGSVADPTDLSLTVSVSESNKGSGSAHNNVQPTIIFNKIIKAV